MIKGLVLQPGGPRCETVRCGHYLDLLLLSIVQSLNVFPFIYRGVIGESLPKILHDVMPVIHIKPGTAFNSTISFKPCSSKITKKCKKINLLLILGIKYRT